MGTKYRNDDIRTAITDNTKLDGYSGLVPSEIEGKIQLNVDVTPNNNRKTNFFYSSRVRAQDTPIYIILDNTRDFFLTNFFITTNVSGAGIGQAKSDTIQVTINGITNDLIVNSLENSIYDLCNTITINLLNPLKLDIGSTIAFILTSEYASFGIYGYYVDPNIYDTGVEKPGITIK